VIGPIVLGSDGSLGEAIFATHAERKVRMDGPEVFRHAVARMSEVTLAAADAQEFRWTRSTCSSTTRPTRGSRARSVSVWASRPSELVDCIETLGNASAATLPVALHAAERDGRLKPGARVLISAFGAGFTWGGGVFEWGEAASG